jgi:hypothetical protein
MCDFEKRWEFRTTHMPVFLLSIFLGILSYSVALILVLDSYFYHESLDWKIKFYIINAVVLSTLQVASGFRILHGHPRWVAGMIVLYALCLIASLPAMFFQKSFAFYSVGLCLPLAGLYCLNSARFRAMLTAAVDLRFDRKSAPNSRITMSRREIAIRNRLRDQESKAAAARKRARNKITYPIGALVVLLIIGALGYLIYDGFASGYILLGGRGQPVTRYTLSAQPGGFWFGITMYVLCIMLFIAALGVMRLMWKMEARE